MKIKISGRALIITFIAAAMIALVSTYNPQGLILKDKDGNPLFRVGYKKGGSGELGTNGVQFNDVTEAGEAQLTMLIPNDVKDRKAWVKTNYTQALANLEAIAPQILAAATAASEMEGKINEAIVVE